MWAALTAGAATVDTRGWVRAGAWVDVGAGLRGGVWIDAPLVWVETCVEEELDPVEDELELLEEAASGAGCGDGPLAPELGAGWGDGDGDGPPFASAAGEPVRPIATSASTIVLPSKAGVKMAADGLVPRV